jgi:hypothetical protein
VRYSVFRALYGHTNLNPESKEANILQEQQATEAITGGTLYVKMTRKLKKKNINSSQSRDLTRQLVARKNGT